MIYDSINDDAPLCQGDIFRGVPRVELSLDKMPLVSEDAESAEVVDWSSVASAGKPVAAILPIRSVTAIVLTQNCDASRGEYIALAQVDSYEGIIGSPPGTTKKWMRKIVQFSRENLRYFYLPQDPTFGISTRMAADFRVIIRLPREQLERRRSLRIGRLNRIATEHFRETLAQYFRRYPYDEWYPLTKEEFAEYGDQSPEPVTPFPWQVADE